MDRPTQHDLAGTVGTDVGRLDLMKEIVVKIGGLDATASDDDLDRWWGAVEGDRLASGLTLATIDKLSEPNGEGDPAGSWLQKSDATGDELTRLTPAGREAIRLISAAGGIQHTMGAAADW